MNIPLSPSGNHSIRYGYCRTLEVPLGTAITLIQAALKAEGFGTLFEIDLKEKFKEKLGVDFKKYVVLGVCHPALAYKALLEEMTLGVLLPCHVAVFEDRRQSTVAVIDAAKALALVGNAELEPIAKEINAKLRRALDSIG
jgi:uncharacterized protein (DUF302 family)